MQESQISMRMDSKLKEEAAKLAARQGRTLGNLIKYLLQQELEKDKKEKATR